MYGGLPGRIEVFDHVQRRRMHPKVRGPVFEDVLWTGLQLG
jgi:hypothetical protein